MDIFKISIRSLVEFIMRSGDIDRTVGAVSEAEAMQEGGRIHRKLQRAAGAGYRAEVPMRLAVTLGDDLTFVLEGRADGVITDYRLPDITDLMDGTRNGGKADTAAGAAGDKEAAGSGGITGSAGNAGAADAAVMAEAADSPVFLNYEYYTIDEIKSTYTNLNKITEPVPVHLAQAKCYAYIYARENQLPLIDVQMTYVNIETGAVKRFRETEHFSELEGWFMDLLERYAVWVRRQLAWTARRDQSIRDAAFPFPYREGQRRFVGGVYRTIVQGKKLFALAPTGTGKTIATLFPAIKAMGEGRGSRIFYLTAKTITRTVAEETFHLLAQRGLAFKSVTLTARDKICIFDEARCRPQDCERACGHFDRVNDAVFDMITHENEMTRAVIEAYAAKHSVCPFEMQLDAALWCDGIICDYNYVFDPSVYLKRFFGETYDGGTKTDYILLIDEAHNLVERAREMYSAALRLSDLAQLKRQIHGHSANLSAKIEKCRGYMQSLSDDSEDFQVVTSLGALTMHLMRMMTDMEIFMKGGAPAEIREKVLSVYLDVRRFVNTYDNMDERYVIYSDRMGGQDFMIKIYCIDPSKDLGQRLDRGGSAVFFSATLLPVSYYKTLLSTTPETDYDLYIESPFDSENRRILLATDVSSRYTRRNLAEYRRISEYIRTIVRARAGNYLVFFPSYAYMEAVSEVFSEMELCKAGCGIRMVIQENAMTEAARQDFLDQFQAETTSTVIGFCVLGGIFSEGIDLKAERLIGAVIVGTGLPQIGSERELLRDYYDRRQGCGYEYAYVYPGMNKVLQAGGRVIRTEHDRGVIALLDDRFLTPTYRGLFPKEWQPYDRVNLSTVEKAVNDFWEKNICTI